MLGGFCLCGKGLILILGLLLTALCAIHGVLGPWEKRGDDSTE